MAGGVYVACFHPATVPVGVRAQILINELRVKFFQNAFMQLKSFFSSVDKQRVKKRVKVQ